MAIPQQMQELWAIVDEELSKDLDLYHRVHWRAHEAGLCNLLHCAVCFEGLQKPDDLD